MSRKKKIIPVAEVLPTTEPSTSKQSNMRPFVLVRSADESGVSGEGVVAEGVEFSNGQVALHWLSQIEAITVYANIRCVETLHGHEDRTKIVFQEN